MPRTPGIPVVTEFKIDVEKLNQTYTLVPFGDMHYGCEAFCWSKWNEFKDRYKNAERTYFLGMGDYQEAFRATDRREIEKMAAADWAMSYFGMESQNLLSELEFMRGRLLGLLDGNHRFFVRQKFHGLERTMDGTVWLAEELGCPYMGNPGFVYLDFHYSTCRTVKKIAAHHGTGGGQLEGSTFNALGKFLNDYPNVDIVLMGDDHQLGWKPHRDKLDPKRPTKEKPVGDFSAVHRFMGRTGSFKRAYMAGKESWEADRAFAPSHLGNLEIHFVPVKQVREGRRKFGCMIGGGTPPVWCD